MSSRSTPTAGAKCHRAGTSLKSCCNYATQLSPVCVVSCALYIAAAVCWEVYMHRASNATAAVLILMKAMSHSSVPVLWVQQDAVGIVTTVLFAVVALSVVLSALLPYQRTSSSGGEPSSPGPAPPPTAPLQLRLLSCHLQIALLWLCSTWAISLAIFCSLWALAAAWVRSMAQDTIRAGSGMRDPLALAYNVTSFLQQYTSTLRPQLDSAAAALMDRSLTAAFWTGADKPLAGYFCPITCLSLRFVKQIVGGDDCICDTARVSRVEALADETFQALKPALVALLVLCVIGAMLLVRIGAMWHALKAHLDSSSLYYIYKNAASQEEGTWWQETIQDAAGCWRRSTAGGGGTNSRSTRAQRQQQQQEHGREQQGSEAAPSSSSEMQMAVAEEV